MHCVHTETCKLQVTQIKHKVTNKVNSFPTRMSITVPGNDKSQMTPAKPEVIINRLLVYIDGSELIYTVGEEKDGERHGGVGRNV